MIIEPVALLKDNYAYLIHDPKNKKTAVVDPSEADPILKVLKQKGWSLDYVINTHHHWDHVGGNAELKKATGCEVVVSEYDRSRIEGADSGLVDGDSWSLGSCSAQIFYIPGHTLGHIALWFESEKAVFTGDTLFALGCGRLFEGSPEQMWASLSRLALLPGDTRVYCGHEYTHAHTFFALTIEPENSHLQERVKRIKALHETKKPTVPSLMEEEFETNPFLRAKNESIRQRLGMLGASDAEVFAEIRRRKDGFRT
jgi:hydroxyacylglutathione hydrolase